MKLSAHGGCGFRQYRDMHLGFRVYWDFHIHMLPHFFRKELDVEVR